MQALLAQGYEGKINLIYIDPPFDSKADYSHRMTIEGNEFTKEPSVIERLAYKDTWAGGTDSYLDMLYPRLQLMNRLLAEDGTLYLHCDWRVVHYLKVILDEIFGPSGPEREGAGFKSEIIWFHQVIGMPRTNPFYFPKSHETIISYSKSEKVKTKFNSDSRAVRKPFSDSVLKSMKTDENGNSYYSRGRTGTVNPWAYDPKYLKTKIDPDKGVLVSDVWDDWRSYQPAGNEKTNFATQKPEFLLNRIIEASSGEGDIVADFFAGSGTTGAVAERLGRRWIMCELGKVGVQVTRARFVEMGAKPFLIENIGNYQREMIYLTGGRIWEMQQLVLKLYGATPRDKTSGLGVKKAADGIDELVYVGYPDRPVTAKKAEELALQAEKLDGTGYKRLVILGWDYEYNYHQALEARLKGQKERLKVAIQSRDIPPDIYDYLKKAKTEEDIEPLAEKVHFYERPYLKLSEPETKDEGGGKTRIKIGIKRYVLMDIPVSQTSEQGTKDYEALMRLAKDNFAVLIDYWAIDWEYDGCTFKSQWQAFRGNGKKAKTVPIIATETLEKKKRVIAVRVVDIFGNDAGATVEI
ncbi:MAG: site-specific DNA-methyltransferase [Planctomycetota bacterium]